MSADTDDTDRPVNPPRQPPVVPIEPPALPRPAQLSDPRAATPPSHRHASDTGSIASHSLEAFHDPAGVVGRGGFTFGSQSMLNVPQAPHNPHAADDLHKRRAR